MCGLVNFAPLFFAVVPLAPALLSLSPCKCIE